ncbi:hypothetical protein [Methanocalculus sp. MC3]
MDSPPRWVLRFMTILAACIPAFAFGTLLNLPIPAIILAALGCYILGDIIIQIPKGTYQRRRRV